MTFRTRFAPSPTGPLHLGHAFSALTAFELANAHNGTFLLRIEDIDRSRARPEWEAQIYDDLDWLGLHWPDPVMRQSDRQTAYDAALDMLWARGLLYPCPCTRRDIDAAASAPQEGVPTHGPDGIIYPGTCRHSSKRTGGRPENTVLRLDVQLALAEAPAPFLFEETGPEARCVTFCGNTLLSDVGDVVLARKDMGTSYHLSVVLDDAAQGITHVVRGQDLFDATNIHVLLQRLLDLPTPIYHHHRLIRDEKGKRLAKRDDARAISRFRSYGASRDDVLHLIGLHRL